LIVFCASRCWIHWGKPLHPIDSCGYESNVSPHNVSCYTREFWRFWSQRHGGWVGWQMMGSFANAVIFRFQPFILNNLQGSCTRCKSWNHGTTVMWKGICSTTIHPKRCTAEDEDRGRMVKCPPRFGNRKKRDWFKPPHWLALRVLPKCCAKN